MGVALRRMSSSRGRFIIEIHTAVLCCCQLGTRIDEVGLKYQ